MSAEKKICSLCKQEMKNPELAMGQIIDGKHLRFCPPCNLMFAFSQCFRTGEQIESEIEHQ